MSTVEKEKEQKANEVNSGCCGVEKQNAAALAVKVEQVKSEEAAKEKKAGGCGCS